MLKTVDKYVDMLIKDKLIKMTFLVICVYK